MSAKEVPTAMMREMPANARPFCAVPLAGTAFAVAMFAQALPAWADTFQWTDDEGNVHATDRLEDLPPKIREAYEERQKKKAEPGAGAPSQVTDPSGLPKIPRTWEEKAWMEKIKAAEEAGKRQNADLMKNERDEALQDDNPAARAGMMNLENPVEERKRLEEEKKKDDTKKADTLKDTFEYWRQLIAQLKAQIVTAQAEADKHKKTAGEKQLLFLTRKQLIFQQERDAALKAAAVAQELLGKKQAELEAAFEDARRHGFSRSKLDP